MMSSWFDLGSTSKILNISLLRFNKWSRSENHGPEFKYRDGNVLDTQPYLTRGLTSTHCIPHLNPIKGKFNIVILTHTCPSMHPNIQTQHTCPKT